MLLISIFNGRKISLDGTTEEIYAQVGVALRDKIYLFNSGKTLTPFGVFMKIALHTDQWGWAYPGRENIKRGTGVQTDGALSSALRHLREMRIEGYRVLAHYRERDPTRQTWGSSLYRIFPDAWVELETYPLEHLPEKFKRSNIMEFRGRNASPVSPMQRGLELLDPIVDDPELDDRELDHPELDDPILDDQHQKYTQLEEGPLEEENQEEESSPSPSQQRVQALREKMGTDPLDVACHCHEVQASTDLPGWSVPAAAGGADPFQDDPFMAFCQIKRFAPDAVPNKDKEQWAKKFRAIAEHHNINAATLGLCIRALPYASKEKLPGIDLDWRVGGFTHPYAGGFEDVVGAMIIYYRSHPQEVETLVNEKAVGDDRSGDRRWAVDVG